MEQVSVLLSLLLLVSMCFNNQVNVLANPQSVSMLSLKPPEFPNLLYTFRQSLSASSQLRQLASEVENIHEMPCVCHGLSHTNWTRFSLQPSSDLLSEMLVKNCLTEPLVLSVGNWTMGSKPESAGMVEQGKALIIGISTGLIIALSVGAILVVFRKGLAVGPTACPTLPLVTRRQMMIQRQRSNCQQIVLVPPLQSAPNPAGNVMSNYCQYCCHRCMQVLSSWCQVLVRRCESDNSSLRHSLPHVDVPVELSTFDKKSRHSANPQ